MMSYTMSLLIKTKKLIFRCVCFQWGQESLEEKDKKLGQIYIAI